MTTITLPEAIGRTLVELPGLPAQTARRTFRNDVERRAFMQILADRYGDQCAYCGQPFHRNLSKKARRRIPVAVRRIPTLDHLVPHQILPAGGADNYVLACSPCNQAKGNRVPAVLVLFLAVLVTQHVALRRMGVQL